MFDALCISDCCCDLIFKGLRQVPAPGTEEYCQSFYMKAGGGANTPMGLAKLGCRTAYATALGDDAMGSLVRQEMEQAGLSPVYLQQAKGSRTWVSAVLSTVQDRAFASFAGQGVALEELLLLQMLKGVRWVHTYSYYCEKFPFLAGACRQVGVPLSLDATFEPGKTLEQVRPLLAQAVLFTPNEVEARALTGETDLAAALNKLALVCPNVVITLGAGGCMAALDGLRLRAFAPPVTVVDTNGAGDLFNAGLIAARLQQKGPQQQLQFAAASGALAVTYPGGVGEGYTRLAVEELAAAVTVQPL